MKVRVFLAVALLAAVAAIGGAPQQADAGTNAPGRAFHCSSGPPFYFPYNYVYAFVGSGSGSTGGTSLYPCFATATVTASPAEHWRFKDWSGVCAGQGASCNVFVAHGYYDDGPYVSYANFERIRQSLTVQRSGSGTVRSDPGGIDCGNTCSAEFDQGSEVALEAIAPPGVQFNGWGGACGNAGQNARCVVGIPPGGAAVTASFGPPPVDLAVTTIGKGTVTSSPGGISCGGTCTAKFPAGSQVTLTAAGADADHPFIGWAGACSGSSPTCTVTMSGAQSVRARFVAGKVDGLAAAFDGSWKQSRYTGSLVVSGTAENTLQLTVKLLPFGKSDVLGSFPISVPAGAFRQSFRLPALGVFPGQYVVNVSGTAEGGSILPKNERLKMEAPKEGVVSRAWITLGKGKEVTRAPRGSKRLVANFVYAAKPYIGSKVTVSWFLGKKPLGTVKKIRWKPIVVTDVASPVGLPSGRYTCVLKARGLVVYEVVIRVD